ncbi:type II toxin-antitoxin system RelB/DinJ family antitoxin [Acetobacteraceae bacterium]|nr:type II toxin-antitoxin system RelB/DinJ family antitoxin [Acetobacteraceae bacterium]
MALTSEIRVRVDSEIKAQATATLENIGLNISDLVRMTVNRVAKEGKVPFEVKIPNPTTQRAMESAQRGEGTEYNSPDNFFKSVGI